MAIKVGEAYVDVVPRFTTFGRDLATGVESRVVPIGKGAGAKLGEAVGQGATPVLGARLRDLAGTAGKAIGLMSGAALVAAGTLGLKTASRLEQARIGFTTMLGSAQKADAFLRQLQQFAAATPFEFPDLVTASQRLLAMGIAAQDVIPTLTAIGDAAAGLGKGPEVIERMVLAIGQMSAKGRVMGDELLQLTEAGIPAIRILADSYHVSVAEMTKMVTAGKVLSDRAIPALVQGIEHGTKSTAAFGGMMEKQSHTMAGMFSTLKDVVSQTLANLVSPFIPKIEAGLGRITELVQHSGLDAQHAGALFDTAWRRMGEVLHLVGPPVLDIAHSVGSVLVPAFQAGLVVGRPLAALFGGAIVGGLHALATVARLAADVLRPLFEFIASHAGLFQALTLGVVTFVAAFKTVQLVRGLAQQLAATFSALVTRASLAAEQLVVTGGAMGRLRAATSGLAVGMGALNVGLGLASLGVVLWAGEQAKAKQHAAELKATTEGLTEALKQNSQAFHEQVAAMATKDSELANLVQQKLGLSMRDYTLAVQGNRDQQTAFVLALSAAQRQGKLTFEEYVRLIAGYTDSRTAVADAIGATQRYRDALGGAGKTFDSTAGKVVGLGGAVGATTIRLSQVPDMLGRAGTAARVYGDLLGGSKLSTDAIKTATQQLSTAIQDVNSRYDYYIGRHVNLVTAEASFREAMIQAGDQLKKNKGSLDGNTAAGNENIATIGNLITNAEGLREKMQQGGASADKATLAFYRQLNSIRDLGIKSGVSAGDMDKLLGRMLNVDRTKVKPTIDANIKSAEDKLRALQQKLADAAKHTTTLPVHIDVHPVNKTITVTFRPSGPNAAVASVYSTGGMVHGPGGDTSDSVPALLSRGEYVVRAAKVRQVGQAWLDALNFGPQPATPLIPIPRRSGRAGSPGESAAGLPGAQLAPAAVQLGEIRIFIGTREITDIVRAEYHAASGQVALQVANRRRV